MQLPPRKGSPQIVRRPFNSLTGPDIRLSGLQGFRPVRTLRGADPARPNKLTGLK